MTTTTRFRHLFSSLPLFLKGLRGRLTTRIKTRGFPFILLLVCTAKINAQQANFFDVQSEFLKFTTPNSASFNKFIDHPVSLYNGTPEVSVPIYTLIDGAIEIPIVLRYNTSGVKVSEEAGWVGLGWNLNVGGLITQNVIGEYDDCDVSYNATLQGFGNVDFANNERYRFYNGFYFFISL